MPKQTVALFVRKWKACKACPLHHWAHRHVLYRGQIPAEVVLIGEAPGKVEDKLGRPFVGPSGQLLDALLSDLKLTSFCIINVVCCIPWKNNAKNTEIRPPSVDEANACEDHIIELLELAKPKLIVFLGKEAEKTKVSVLLAYQHAPAVPPLLPIRHPAYILRNGGVTSLEYKRNLHALSKALSDAGILHQIPPVTKVG